MCHQHRVSGVGFFLVGQDGQLRCGDDHFRVFGGGGTMDAHVADKVDLLALAAHVAIISGHGDGRPLRALVDENGEAKLGAVVVRIMANFRRFQRVGQLAGVVQLAQGGVVDDVVGVMAVFAVTARIGQLAGVA